MTRSISMYQGPEGMQDFGKQSTTPKSSTRDDFGLGNNKARMSFGNIPQTDYGRRSTLATTKNAKPEKQSELLTATIEEENEDDDQPFDSI